MSRLLRTVVGKVCLLVVAAGVLVLLAAGAASAQSDLPTIMGSGNFSDGGDTNQLRAQFQALNSAGVKSARYTVHGYWNNNTQQSTPQTLDSLIRLGHSYGAQPQLVFEYYTHTFPVPLGGYDKWYKVGRAYAERFRPNSPWLQSQGIYNWGVTIYAAFNEPDYWNQISRPAYRDALKGLADGIHSIDGGLKVIPGGFMSANAWSDYSLRGYGTAIADLLNDGTLDGIDLHTYHSFWTPIDSNFYLGNHHFSAQRNFDAIKATCGITRDINFYTSEYNYQRMVAEGGGSPRQLSEQEAAKYFMTTLWDNLGVVGNNNRSATKLAMVWTLFTDPGDTASGNYALASQLNPWVPTNRGALYRLVAEKTAGMTFASLDPKGSGEYVLTGNNKKMWVWQNRPGWTNHPGTSFTVSGIPGGVSQLEVYGWNGLRSTIPLSGQSSYTVGGLPQHETYMFLVNVTGFVPPPQPTPVPPQPTPVPPQPTPPPTGAYYRLVARHSGRCLDINAFSQADGAQVIQYECHSGANQQWRLVDVGGGQYNLVVRHSGKVLDVIGASTANGAGVTQHSSNGGANQRWRVEPLGNGYHRIIAVHSGKALDINASFPGNGGTPIQYDYHGNYNQQWLLQPAP